MAGRPRQKVDTLKKNLTNSLTARTLSDFYAALGGFEQSLSVQ